jgi:hypothetical protein
MAVNQRFLAKCAIQGACWALGWRLFAAFFGVAVSSLLMTLLMPGIAVFIEVMTFVVSMWILLRFALPAMIHLRRHYWRVFDLSVPAEPSMAKAIVTEQWANLGNDLMLPWRAIRG